MSSATPGGGSIYASFILEERKAATESGTGEFARVGVDASGGSARLGAGAKWGPRLWHRGHYLSGSKINNVVKVAYVKNNGDARRHTSKWLQYIQDRERAPEEPERKFFNRDRNNIEREEVKAGLLEGRGKDAAFFKIMLSPKQNELDHEEYTRKIMERWEEVTGIKTDWYAVKHENTLYHHVHIVMPGKDVDGHSYRLDNEHLDLMRDIANEHQYELQGLKYEYEKQIEYEFGQSQDDFERLLKYQSGKEVEWDLGLTSPALEDALRDLYPPTNFDDIKFRQELELTGRGASKNQEDSGNETNYSKEPTNDVDREAPSVEISSDEVQTEMQSMDREVSYLQHGANDQEQSYEASSGPTELAEFEIMRNGALEDESAGDQGRGDDEEFFMFP